jgi:CRP-like cAMP-binding protein
MYREPCASVPRKRYRCLEKRVESILSLLASSRQTLSLPLTVPAKSDQMSHMPSQRVPVRDSDGNIIHNEIVLSLPEEERAQLIPRMEFQRVRIHHVLHEPGAVLKSAYFCDTGLVSVLAISAEGKSVEVGLIGKEGFVGLPLVAGFTTSPTRAIAQIAGTVFRVNADAMRGFFRSCPVLELKLQQFGQIMAMQVTQLAVCNRLHDVNERLARWLLMSADRVGSNQVPLTQEFLGQMLGTRRSSVTVSAGTLANAGLITYNRGDVKILNRQGLEEATCECYGIMVRQIAEWKEQAKREQAKRE